MNMHASCISLGGRGLLILGPSGAGKSSLALSLMAIGAGLVADDRTCLRREGAQVIADVPDTLRGRIEARGAGILAADAAGPTALALIVDLGRVEDQRLPPERTHDLLGVSFPLVLGPYTPHLAPVLKQYLLKGRIW
ncbi:serine kinase [Paracoccus sp. DMF-8]|uniref:HPr kinase/phosphorylase n=1 Tax=Paracoccus sp. DMF-8 TaxID=3019445 RepID=UPI0023E85BFE|nr:serine kinase [Paracoccus sp. DMF-8]MDF3605645.1 serine kinase [Paracoccus sp. DMF-8]